MDEQHELDVKSLLTFGNLHNQVNDRGLLFLNANNWLYVLPILVLDQIVQSCFRPI